MTGARALWLSLALMLAGLALIVLWSGPRIEAGGLAPFDTRTSGYDLGEARAFLAALSPEGRAAYLGPQRLADTLFPLGLAASMMLVILRGLAPLSRPLARAGLVLPLAYLAADMAENAAVSGLLRSGSDALAPEMVARASALTVWKFRLVNAALALTAAALVLRAVEALTRRRR